MLETFCILMLMMLAGPYVVGRLIMRSSSNDACEQLRVAITVSSLISDPTPRQMQVSWDYAKPADGDWVGFFTTDPTETPLPTPVKSVIPHSASGLFNTSVQEPQVNSNALSFQKQCLGYWAAYVREGTVLASACLSTEPTWMADMKNDLSPLKLREIFLPGTHDSGAYKKYEPEVPETIIIKYSITQEEDILSQLVHGVRYIDLRVGYYSSTDELWWVNHGVVRLHPLKKLLNSVRKFLTNTNEIVILDAQEFPSGFGTGNAVHAELIKYLESQVGDLLVSPTLTWDTTLGAIWNSRNRLILSYDKADVVAGNSILWPAVKQQWGNVQTLEDLYQYLAGIAAKPDGRKATAAMAELTPTAWQVITNQLGGLRRMADTVNRNVTAWYWGEWGRTVNVVAADFFKGTGLVDAAIQWNKHRAHNITCAP